MPGKFSKLIERKTPAGEDATQVAGKPAATGNQRLSKADDENYRVTTIRAHIDIFADADANVRKLRIGKDRSDLINHLLNKWNAKPEPF